MATPTRRPTPSAQMVAELAEAQRQGLEFDVAWTQAWRAVRWPHDTEQRREWKIALRSTQDEWWTAYHHVDTKAAKVFRDLVPLISLMVETFDQPSMLHAA